MRIVRCTAWLGVLAGCYAPFPREGAPCETSDHCPATQRCMRGSCWFGEAPAIDASNLPDAPEPVDASIDAPPPPPIDAQACSTAGLVCSAAVTMFSCGGKCWVYCRGAVPRATAQSRCAAWTGALGEINDPAEQACVDGQVVTQVWLGLQQSNTAITPTEGWTWNGVSLPTYTNWLSGKPDDGSNGENGAEQCADMRTDGRWDDNACGSSADFVCERP